MAKCRGCENKVDEAVEKLCADCREGLGLLMDELPVQRPAGPCRRCDGSEIVQALLRDRNSVGSSLHMQLAPIALAYGVYSERAVFGRNAPARPLASDFQGMLVAYACRSCGYTELYTLDAPEIPIGVEHGTKLLRYENAEAGPYR